MADGSPSPNPDPSTQTSESGLGLPFPGLGPWLPLLCSLYALPWINWQRAMLKFFEEWSSQAHPSALADEDTRTRIAKLAMKAYLDSEKWRADWEKQLGGWQSDLVRAYAEILDSALRTFDRKTSA